MRRIQSKKYPYGKTYSINGKLYVSFTKNKTKKEATEWAEWYRKGGGKVRLKKMANGKYNILQYLEES